MHNLCDRRKAPHTLNPENSTREQRPGAPSFTRSHRAKGGKNQLHSHSRKTQLVNQDRVPHPSHSLAVGRVGRTISTLTTRVRQTKNKQRTDQTHSASTLPYACGLTPQSQSSSIDTLQETAGMLAATKSRVRCPSRFKNTINCKSHRQLILCPIALLYAGCDDRGK